MDEELQRVGEGFARSLVWLSGWVWGGMLAVASDEGNERAVDGGGLHTSIAYYRMKSFGKKSMKVQGDHGQFYTVRGGVITGKVYTHSRRIRKQAADAIARNQNIELWTTGGQWQLPCRPA